MAEKYPTMEKCYRLKDATDSAIFEKNDKGIARIGNDVKGTQNQIGTLYNYYMEHQDEMPPTEYSEYTPEEQVAFYVTGLNNVTIAQAYKSLIEHHPELDIKSSSNSQPNIGIEQDEISPTNENLIEKIGDEINFEENQVIDERNIDSKTHNAKQDTNRIPILESAINISKTTVNSKDIQGMVNSVKDRQNTQEIQQNIGEVSKDEGR